MSINFYLRTPHDAPDAEGLHIGQDAARTQFLFRAHPAMGLTNADAWRSFLERPGMTIVSEYGAEYPLEEFWARATLRPADAGGPNALYPRWPAGARGSREWNDAAGHPFADYEFS
ncbi:hypothetical protein ACFXGA_25855 [Actinosynnema sp. NPDC059335]|uniref:hypothetical protein n=1 Tax=Actinosynnema sp. NPDC059335 TaxID=3346804 RepID=UPI00366F367B